MSANQPRPMPSCVAKFEKLQSPLSRGGRVAMLVIALLLGATQVPFVVGMGIAFAACAGYLMGRARGFGAGAVAALTDEVERIRSCRNGLAEVSAAIGRLLRLMGAKP